jgi:tRNA A-37 threonylcarbamoyl transferase component Bud32
MLAPDPALPQRDLLLDPRIVAPVLERQLGLAGPLDLTRCEVGRVKYRLGESLRVRYRVEADGRGYEVAGRMFRAGGGETAYRRALQCVVATGALRPVGWSPGLETVFWTFPNDRRLRLGAVAELPRLLGRPVRALQLVAYAPEKSATVRCDGEGGPLGYAKLYADDGATRAHALYERLSAARAPVPRVLAFDSSLRTLVVEPLAGRPLAALSGDELVHGYRLVGGAVARLHQLGEPGPARFRRLDPERLAVAAELIARARPDAAAPARALARELLRDGPREPDVCLHGDLHPKNALIDGWRVGLVDLDQSAGGPASADIGSALAGLRYERVADGLAAEAETALADAFLAGYEAVRPLPAPAALRRATAAALLAERALRAVNRVRPRGLAALVPLLDEARAVLDG